MEKVHWHKRVLNKICLDERLSPNRRFLASVIGLYINSQTPEEKELFKTLILAEFINKSGIKLFDKEDEAALAQKAARNGLEQAADTKVKDALAAILGEEPDASSV